MPAVVVAAGGQLDVEGEGHALGSLPEGKFGQGGVGEGGVFSHSGTCKGNLGRPAMLGLLFYEGRGRDAGEVRRSGPWGAAG